MPAKTSFIRIAAVLLLLRLLHFGSEIDAPHDWRQCDTANYIRDFYENGIDLLHPKVCWMGASDTVALEFPLPEAVVAFLCGVFGNWMFLQRLIFLGFFACAAFYFYRIVQLIFGEKPAQLSTLVYLALPLGLFYSRAIHIDFSVILAAHAMLYYFLTGVKNRLWKYMVMSGVFAIMAVLMKIPYVFCLLPVMIYWIFQQKAWSWFLKTGVFYLPALAAFWWWQRHVTAINSAMPDLSYIAHYRKMTQSATWYFGTWAQRLSLYSWKVLVQRSVLDIAGIGGIVFLIFGLKNFKKLPNAGLLFWWIAGLAAYLLVFFNLNFVHDYYQIPLLAPAAILCAQGILFVSEKWKWPVGALFSLLAVLNILYAEISYYQINPEQVEVARLIRENTPDSALVIVTYDNMDCRDPRVLYRAHRRGWSVENGALKPDVIERLRKEQGAQVWVYVGTHSLPAQMDDYLYFMSEKRTFSLDDSDRFLYVFNLITSE